MFLGKEDFRSKMKRVFLDISIDGVPMGRIEIELFCDLAPLTTENFRSLCTGEAGKAPDGRTNLCYKGSTFHRIVKGFMIQGGDITFGDGRGGCSIYGSQFDDEEFAESHSKPYLVSMANKGPNTNSSQFFITTSIAPHCDNKHVVFGRVVRGQSVVNTIESVKSDESGRPAKDVIIVNCGELFKKKKENSDEKEKNKETKKNGRNDEEEEKEKEDEAEKLLIPECPKSWLYREDKEKIQKRRRSISREKRRKRERKEETYRRGRSIERRRIVDDSGIQVRGRGGITYRKDRSITPIHWKINAPKKTYKMKKEEKSIIDLEKKI